ncbi:MAG TPA: hypothetical protein VGX68_08570 [Thermoanaerobaculia bacterium]|jgi:hypothetical protein|nr:hypothetical protein [Thermoanaerobaculia bacterium]
MAEPHRTEGETNLEQWPAVAAMPEPTRRGFLKLAATLGLTLWVTPAGAARLVFAGQDEITGPRNPELTGLLLPEEVRDLWRIFEFIGSTWDNGKLTTIASRQDLKKILDLKTGAVPSYLTEYREAVRIFHSLRAQFGDKEALRRILFEEPDARLRQFVVVEFLRLQVASGGFLRFGGYKNYPGYPGGPFDDPSNLPYRPIST